MNIKTNKQVNGAEGHRRVVKSPVGKLNKRGEFKGIWYNLLVGALFLFLLFSFFSSLFIPNFHDNNKFTNLNNKNQDNEMKIPELPEISSLVTENLTIPSGEDLYEDRSYNFNSTLYNSANNFTEFTSGELQTKLVGDDIVFNDSISVINNTEIQVPHDESFNFINGTNNGFGTLDLFDGNYHDFSSNSLSECYNATYSFTNDADGVVPAGWTDIGAGTEQVISELDGHRKIAELDNNGVIYNEFSNQVSGTIEYWFRTNSAAAATMTGGFYLKDGAVYAITLGVYNGVWAYYRSGWQQSAIAVNVDTWYRCVLDFDTDTDKMTFSTDADGVVFNNVNFRTASGAVEHFELLGNPSVTCYWDGIGYSWDTGYTLGDNAFQIPQDINVTCFSQFSNFDKDLLGINISYSYKTDIYQYFNISIWDNELNGWVTINNSDNSDSFFLMNYENDSNLISTFFNSSGHLVLKFYGRNASKEFSLFIDYLTVKIYYKLDVSVSKSFNIVGNWKYRWHLVGSDYYSSWVYFEVIDSPIPIQNNFLNLNITSITNIKELNYNFSRIKIEGFLNCSDSKKYLIRLNYFEIDHSWDYNLSNYYTDILYYHYNLILENNGSYIQFETIEVYGNSYFKINGIWMGKFDEIGCIMPHGDIDDAWDPPYFSDQIYSINFSISPLLNQSNNKTYLFTSTNFRTSYQIESMSVVFLYLQSNSLEFYIFSKQWSNEEHIHQQVTENTDFLDYSFTQENGLYIVQNIDCIRGIRIKKNTGAIQNQNFIEVAGITFNYSKELCYLLPNYLNLFQGNYEIQKYIRLFSRNEQIDSSNFQLELVFDNLNPNYYRFKYNLTGDIFYSYPWLYNYSFSANFPITNINVYYQNELIATENFNFYSFNSQYIDITLPDKYNPQPVYFAIFSYDGLGLNKDLIRFYINGSRKDLGFNNIIGSYVNLTVLDYFNHTLFSQIVDCRNLTEYNMFIDVYTLNLVNLFMFDDIRVNISQIGSGIWMSQIIPKQMSFPYRFLPNLNYSIVVYFINNSIYSSTVLNLTENGQIESFGVSERYPETSFFPKDMWISLYNPLGFGITEKLRIYKNATRISGGMTTIETNYTNIVVLDYFDNVLYNRTVNYAPELNILINVTTVYLQNKYQNSIIIRIGVVAGNWLLYKEIPGFGIDHVELFSDHYYFRAEDEDGNVLKEKSEDIGTAQGQVVDFGFYEEVVPYEPEAINAMFSDYVLIVILLSVICISFGVVIRTLYKKNKKNKDRIAVYQKAPKHYEYI